MYLPLRRLARAFECSLREPLAVRLECEHEQFVRWEHAKMAQDGKNGNNKAQQI